MDDFKIPELITERLILRKIIELDHEHIYKGLSHPDIIKYYGIQYSTLEETQEQINWYANLEKSNSGMWWAIRFKDLDKFCGAIGFNHYQKEHHKAEIGFWLFPEFWRKGIIYEASNSVIDHLFNKLKLHRLEAFVECENINSAKVLNKLGFQHEGKLRDYEMKNGNFISVDLLAKLNPNT